MYLLRLLLYDCFNPVVLLCVLTLMIVSLQIAVQRFAFCKRGVAKFKGGLQTCCLEFIYIDHLTNGAVYSALISAISFCPSIYG